MEYYIGPTTLSYEEFWKEHGWAPGMCVVLATMNGIRMNMKRP